MVGDCVGLFSKALVDPPPQGAPSIRSRLQNVLLSSVAVFVACYGGIERVLLGADGMPVNEVREASLQEVRQGDGRLTGRNLLPSAYEIWVGPRPEGHLRLRFTYDIERLVALLEGADVSDHAPRRVCEPLALDAETIAWVSARVVRPAAASRLAVWRALKRRLYHYDAGVVAFCRFPRNFLLSSGQWAELMADGRTGAASLALDIGAGDGSLNRPMRRLVGRLVTTELTVPLVCRLRAEGLDARVVDEPSSAALGLDAAAFDWVFILNVLDRCKDPFALLAHAAENLKPAGRLVVSVVLPASQCDAAAAVGGTQRRWTVAGREFEPAAASLLRDLLIPAGFVPERLVRTPYLCAGDRSSPIAALDACVVVLRLAGAPPAHGIGVGGAVQCGECGECEEPSLATPLLPAGSTRQAPRRSRSPGPS